MAVAVVAVGVLAATVIVVTGWVGVLIACAVTAVSVELALNRHN